jgi:hypothetical protein
MVISTTHSFKKLTGCQYNVCIEEHTLWTIPLPQNRSCNFCVKVKAANKTLFNQLSVYILCSDLSWCGMLKFPHQRDINFTRFP